MQAAFAEPATLAMDFPYVVHTAELAQQWNTTHPHRIRSINELLDIGSEEQPDLTVVGIPAPSNDVWTLESLSAHSRNRRPHVDFGTLQPSKSCEMPRSLWPGTITSEICSLAVRKSTASAT
jgi:hypothetical protein